MPSAPKGVVVFAHGSGSSRHSPRNRYVAEVLNEHSLGTLLIDLLTADEEQEDEVTGHLRFDIDLLTRRLVAITDWHQAAVQKFRASIRDLVVLVDNSAADSDFNLAQRRIRAARRACEVARDAMENHQAEHGY